MRADWKDLPAGPALDALVAVEVMGWEPLSYTAGVSGWIDSREHGHRDGAENYWENLGVDEISVHAWVPSTNIGVAWQVVDAMEARIAEHAYGNTPMPWPHANHLTLAIVSARGSAAATWCSILDDAEWVEHPERHGGTMGDTPALAICRAALAAVESAR